MTSSRESSPVAVVLLVSTSLFLVSPALVYLMGTGRSSNTIENQAQREARNSSSFAVMLGEFRTNVGDMIFVKTERYLDSGIGYEPHINEREMATTGNADSTTSAGEAALEMRLLDPKMSEALAIRPGTVAVHSEDGEHGHDHGSENHDHPDHEGHDHSDHDGHDHSDHSGHDHEGHDDSVVKTLIRTADSDFRGFIGQLERQVKPWRDPSEAHEHTAGTELLPWYRLATLADPHNVRNYMMGAWWLKSLKKPVQLREALTYLNEGISANREAYELYLMQGYVLREMGKETDAREKFKKSADLAIKNRPPGGPDSSPDWDITDDEQMAAAMTMHVMLTRDTESTASAILLTRQYMKRIPGEKSLTRVLGQLESGN